MESEDTLIAKTPTRKIKWSNKKIFAIAIVGVMVIAAFAMILPSVMNLGGAGKNPASTNSNNGQREVSYKLGHMFESYRADPDYNRTGGITYDELARTPNPTPGFEPWFVKRVSYGEYIYRMEYPCIGFYNPYSTILTIQSDYDVGFNMWAPYRMYIEAKNITDCATGSVAWPQKDAIFVPHLGGWNAAGSNSSIGGGYINMSWYGTYMTYSEVGAARLGQHFANWFFGVPAGKTPRAFTDDGYWYQLMGKIQYSRQAAVAYLGAPASGNLMDWYNASDASLEAAWWSSWTNNGSAGGPYDIYTTYDYNEDIRYVALKLDLFNSTADSLIIYEWSVSWGMDAQLVRYIEAANITKNGFQNWMQDTYLNISVSPSMSNLTLRAECEYHMMAWEDPSNSVWSGAWNLEMQHMDWTANTPVHTSYPSPYDPYDPMSANPLRWSWAPGTPNYGQEVSYWITPMKMDLAQYETIEISLPTSDIIGFDPWVGANKTLDDVFKPMEFSSHMYWGTAVLGAGNYPQATIENAYDPVTKKITLVGPITWPSEVNATLSNVLMHGVPAIIIDVSRVASYDVVVQGHFTPANLNCTTLASDVTVTALNGTGAIVTGWNGTVNLATNDAGAAFGAASHTYVPGDNGVWATTVTWGATPGNYDVTATDTWFPLDVTGGALGVVVVMIPEFSTLIIPIIGAAAIFFVVSARKKRKEE